MKTLKTLQGLSKAGKILSTIAFVCCIIGACGCVIGLLCLIIGGSTVADFIESTGKVSIGTVYASIVIGLILCISEIIVSRSARLYFIHELDAGTPFTFDGANELLKLGIKNDSHSCGGGDCFVHSTGNISALFCKYCRDEFEQFRLGCYRSCICCDFVYIKMRYGACGGQERRRKRISEKTELIEFGFFVYGNCPP